jgi:cell division protease FtsH
VSDKNPRSWTWWLLLGVGCFAGYVLMALIVMSFVDQAPLPAAPQMAVNDLAQAVKDGRIKSVQVAGNRGVATTTLNQRYAFRLDQGIDFLRAMAAYGATGESLAQVDYVVRDAPPSTNPLGGLAGALPMLFMAAIVLFLLRQPAQDINDQILQFGKSRARRFVFDRAVTRFHDVAGTDEAKQELQEIVEFLREPARFTALGARVPRGVLLLGAPGTGKTLLSRAVAGEAWVPFFSISGSEFVEMVVGVGARRVRDLFGEAKRNAPCIVFIDEVDAIGRRRGADPSTGSDEREQTLNQVLVEMDGFDGNTGVVVIAATNRPDVLDPALLRPGRFDRQIVVPAPDSNGRRAILEVHARGKPLDRSVDLNALARLTPGFSGADLANMMNEGAILAARRNHSSIGMRELEEAMDRVVAGPECASRVVSDAERNLRAYHEAGHALVMRFTPGHDPVQKVTIVPHGTLGGYTRPLPPEDRAYLTRAQFKAMLASALGGHAAEQLVFGETSTGVENDVEEATRIARKMVMGYGMSDRLGPVAFSRAQTLGFVGREISAQRTYSEKTAEAIDSEIRRLVDDADAQAAAVLRDHRAALDSVAHALLQFETLDGADLERLLAPDAGCPLTKDFDQASRPGVASG